MNTDDKNAFDEIKKLSLSILALVDGNKLDEISQLDEQRQSLIKQCFSQPISENDSALIGSMIEEVLAINDKIIVALDNNKNQLSKEFSQFKTSQKATNAYLSNT